jgi:PHD/YefM family antitoxin component YafN of YafNO toxin-antitoxin module
MKIQNDEVLSMQIVPISSARAKLFALAQTTIVSHEPVFMTSKHGNVVLLSEEDFRAIQETVHLQSIPNLVEEVKAGRKASKKNLATRHQLPW